VVWLAAAVGLGAVLGLGVGLGGLAVGIAAALVPVGIALVLRPRWLPLALAITVFTEAYSVGGISISRVAGPAALALLLLQIRRNGPVRFGGLDRPLLVLIGAYSAWAIASSLWTVNLGGSLQEGGTDYAVLSLLLSATYLVAIAGLVTSEREVHRLVVAVWALSSIMGGLAIAEYLQGSARAVGLSGDANFFASLQIVAIPVGAVLVGHVRTGLQRTIVLGGVGLAVGSVITTLSRGGILALVALTMLLAVQPAGAFFRTRARKRLFLGVLIVGAALLLAISYSALAARTSSLFTTADGGSGRENLWKGAVTGVHQHPVFGLGFGAFTSQANDLMRMTPGVDFSAYRLRVGGQPVHNAYLESLVELGPLGLALFLGMLAAAYRALRRSARLAAQHGSVLISGVSRALSLSLIGFALTSVLLSTETDRTLWFLMALALTLPRIAAAPPAPGRRIA
jgi:exopolysaccharide production protein ExoQ